VEPRDIMEVPFEGYANAFNILREPLNSRESFNKYYVIREHSPVAELVQRLTMDKRNSKIAFIGQRGTGKTTELLRIKYELEDAYFGVYFSVLDLIEPGKVDRVDLLLAISLSIWREALAKGVALDKSIVEDFTSWLREVTRLPEDSRKDILHQAKLNDLIKKAIGKMRLESISHKEINEKVATRSYELLEKTNTLILDIEEKTKKKVIVLIDDLDKLQMDASESLREWTTNTKLLKCKIIYVMPISILAIGGAREFDKVMHVPVPPIKDLKGFDLAIMDELKDMVMKRLPLDYLEPNALSHLVAKTGGVLSDLFWCASECCSRAAMKNLPKIDQKVAEEVVEDLKLRYRRMLSSADAEALSKMKSGRLESIRLPELMSSQMVIEYSSKDGKRFWYEIHPVVQDLLSERI